MELMIYSSTGVVGKKFARNFFKPRIHVDYKDMKFESKQEQVNESEEASYLL